MFSINSNEKVIDEKTLLIAINILKNSLITI
jgi:hypothetical protein